MEKTIVGLVEKVKIKGKEALARIDTGAEHSSIDKDLSQKLELGPILRTILIKSASGQKRRTVVETELEIKGKVIKSKFNIANRKHMKYKILIGQNILKQGFLIDPSK